MNRSRHLVMHMPLLVLGLATFASCKDPFGGVDPTNHEPDFENCASSDEWLPDTPPMDMFKPLPHPTTECPFYRGGWQNFLIAMQPDPVTGEPALKSYLTIDEVFDKKVPLAPGSLAPLGQPRGTAKRSWLGDIKQAGQREILVDQNGHSLYYGIHVNQAFKDFIDANDLRTAEKIQSYPKDHPELFFPAGVVEFKSAWQQVDGVEPDDHSLDNWITTKAYVPTITVGKDSMGVPSRILEDRDNPKLITVRLLAIHVVFTLPGHPEFVWASFEHTKVPGDGDDRSAVEGFRDVAPIMPGDNNPDPNDPQFGTTDMTDINPDSLILYKAHTLAINANKSVPEAELAQAFDDVTQTFVGKQTSIYRMYPASKSNTISPDDAISTLNMNVQALFRDHPSDRRGHYRLIGAQWLDKPANFQVNVTLQNDPTSPLLKDKTSTEYQTAAQFDVQEHDRQLVFGAGGTGIQDLLENGADSAFSLTAGEDRLSSTAMESFTQSLGGFPNCFQCHNTQGINANGTPVDRNGSSPKLLDPGLLNVSHVISQFVLEECSGTAPGSVPKTCSQCQSTPPAPECAP